MPDAQEHLSAASEASSTPSVVHRIDLGLIASLATAVRKRTASIDVACTVNPLHKAGSSNVVWFVDFEDDVHWVFRTPQAEWCPLLEKCMRSEITTMKLIQSRTSIPIPRIHDFSVDANNSIGRPYIFFDRVEGTQLCKLWFDPKWFTEERRKNVFRSLVSSMLQLRTLEFSSIGCLEYDPETDSHIVGPLLFSQDDVLEEDTSVSGPYTTVHEYLFDSISEKVSEAPSIDHALSLSLLRLYAGGLPDESLDGPPFVLSMPDFNYQNIFVDDEGNVTGLIDWDGVMTCPRQGGYARYPSWITRDWDPILYGYPKQKLLISKDNKEREGSDHSGEENEEREDNDHSGYEGSERGKNNRARNMTGTEEDTTSGEEIKDTDEPASQLHIPSREELQEDSPQVLQGFRDEYLQAFEDADPISAKYTRNSHVFEAIEIGISSWMCRCGILDRLTEYVFGSGPLDDLSTYSLEDGLRAGQWVIPPTKE